MTKRRFAIASALLLSCSEEQAPPRPQWVVELSTNATPPTLGARLWIDVMDSDGGVVPERQRVIDAPSKEDWPISFGIEPGLGAPPRLRVRFYRFDLTGPMGTPGSTAAVDVTASLPALAEQPLHVQLGLPLECFGVAPDLVQHLSCDPRTGMLAPEPMLNETDAPLHPGTFRAMPSDACRVAVPTGMTCIPGGVYILGSTKLVASPISDPQPLPAHLVELHTFAIDTDEVTVAQVRGLVDAGLLLLHTSDEEAAGVCTYRLRAEPYPMNCISWQDARDACAAFGKRLPTEAEWEYVAGNLAEKSTYPWGEDDALCQNAWVARDIITGSCRIGSGMAATGPLPAGVDTDITRLGVRNLGGNLAEWTSDLARSYDSPCWQGPPLLIDPHCDGDAEAAHRVRGGSWEETPASARVDVRMPLLQGDNAPNEAIGFRCALSMR